MQKEEQIIEKVSLIIWGLRKLLGISTLVPKFKELPPQLWINSGVATGALFGVPSDILIWSHFHSQATVPFVLAGVCWGCVNDDGEKLC